MAPAGFFPSLKQSDNRFYALGFRSSYEGEPLIYDEYGFPIVSEYFKAFVATNDGSSWTVLDPHNELVQLMRAPAFANGSAASDPVVYYFLEDRVYLKVLAASTVDSVTLPISAKSVRVAVDSNDGIHLFWLSHSDELWHGYYDGDWASSVVDTGIQVLHEAHHGAASTAYALYSKSTQLILVEYDTSIAVGSDTVVGDSIAPVENADLLWSAVGGVRIVYSNLVSNSIIQTHKVADNWVTTNITGGTGPFSFLAIAEKSNGDGVVGYISYEGNRFGLAVEDGGLWVTNQIETQTQLNYYRGIDLIWLPEQSVPFIVVHQNARDSVVFYTTHQLPAFYNQTVKSVSIRQAAILTWPTPSEGGTFQYLQKNDDLSDPDGWENIASRHVRFTPPSEARETVIELDAPAMFYRVVETFE